MAASNHNLCRAVALVGLLLGCASSGFAQPATAGPRVVYPAGGVTLDGSSVDLVQLREAVKLAQSGGGGPPDKLPDPAPAPAPMAPAPMAPAQPMPRRRVSRSTASVRVISMTGLNVTRWA